MKSVEPSPTDRSRDRAREAASLDRDTRKAQATFRAELDAAAALEEIGTERRQAGHRLSELTATLDATPERPSAGPLLDLYGELSRVLIGLDTDGRMVVEVNARLRQVIDSIEFDPHPVGSVGLRAYLRPEFVNARGGAHPDDLANRRVPRREPACKANSSALGNWQRPRNRGTQVRWALRFRVVASASADVNPATALDEER